MKQSNKYYVEIDLKLTKSYKHVILIVNMNIHRLKRAVSLGFGVQSVVKYTSRLQI